MRNLDRLHTLTMSSSVTSEEFCEIKFYFSYNNILPHTVTKSSSVTSEEFCEIKFYFSHNNILPSLYKKLSPCSGKIYPQNLH
jgi:hypothetical protein